MISKPLRIKYVKPQYEAINVVAPTHKPKISSQGAKIWEQRVWVEGQVSVKLLCIVFRIGTARLAKDIIDTSFKGILKLVYNSVGSNSRQIHNHSTAYKGS